jgi:hypothetical protein
MWCREGGEPYLVFEIRKLLILESAESLKSPEPTSSGTIWAQTAVSIGTRWGHSATAGYALFWAIVALLIHDAAMAL